MFTLKFYKKKRKKIRFDMISFIAPSFEIRRKFFPTLINFNLLFVNSLVVGN